MKRVFHFSGGRTSAYMVIKYYQPGDIVVFCDTGREHPKTYKFINDFEAFENIPVVRILKETFRDVIKKESMVPNHFKRKCTIRLKIKQARRYLRSIGLFKYIQFVGFRHDEPTRVSGYVERWQAVTTLFPLNEDGTDKPMVLEYWKGKPYNLEIPPILSNCDLCFEKGKGNIIAILSNHPEMADKWISDEEDRELNPNGYTYLKGTTYRQLLNTAKSLGKVYDLNELQPQFNCACTA